MELNGNRTMMLLSLLVLCLGCVLAFEDCSMLENCTGTDIPTTIETVEQGTETEPTTIDFKTEVSETTTAKTTEVPTTTSRTTEVSTESTTTTIKTTTILPSYKTFQRTDHVCLCDVKIKECDINCCCDPDCTESHRHVFSQCEEVKHDFDDSYCFKTNFFYSNKTKYTLQQKQNGLFCIVKDNLATDFKHSVPPAVVSMEVFEKHLKGRRVFSYSMTEEKKIDFNVQPYYDGSKIWVFKNKALGLFEIPTCVVNWQCLSKIAVHFLKEYDTKCLEVIPRNKAECEGRVKLRMTYLTDNALVLTSPNLVNLSRPVTLDEVALPDPLSMAPASEESNAGSSAQQPTIKRKTPPPPEDLPVSVTCYSEDDDSSILAKGYAVKLRKLTSKQFLFADKLINEALLEAQMGTLTKDSHIVHPTVTKHSPGSTWGSTLSQ